jgi:hypothetical protein
MKATIYSVLALLLSLCAAALPAAAQEGKSATFSNEQLEQIVAPIALYPDSLLTQVMMGSTYPLEIVEADRWVKQNKSLKGSALDSALKDKSWDPSVKSLCTVPDVLAKMSENLDWTQDLGDAFLGQKTQLMDSVQRMRGKAYEAGNLKTTEQQVVTQEPEKIIVIEQASPQVVYVPSYSPTVVYGAWSYPTYYYPPMYAPPPAGYGLMAFGVGMAVGAAFWGDSDWGWGHGDVDIDIDRYNNFNRNTNVNWENNQISNRSGNRNSWQHDPSHRKGVNYRTQDVAGKYGARAGTSRVSRDQARGWSQGQAGNRTAAGTQQRDRSQAAAQQRDLSAAGSRTAGADRSMAQRDGAAAGSANRGAGQYDRSKPYGPPNTGSPSRSDRSSAYSGSRSPSMDRAASSRGSASRGTRSYGGGGRAGGRAGGGGRRR